MQVTEMIMMLGVTLLWFWLIYAVLEWRKMRHKNQLQNKIVERFSTVPELNQFLDSQNGGKFLNFLTANGMGPHQKLIAAVTRGIVMLVLGVTLLFVAPFFLEANRDIGVFRAVGIIIAALGVGFLISSVASYKLSKKWGLLEKE